MPSLVRRRHFDGNLSALLRAGIDPTTPETLLATLPFGANDTTCGTETELQVAVAGRREDVDLAITIEQSNFFANVLKRAEAGETPEGSIADLERFLSDNTDRTWENSWVRFPAPPALALCRQGVSSAIYGGQGKAPSREAWGRAPLSSLGPGRREAIAPPHQLPSETGAGRTFSAHERICRSRCVRPGTAHGAFPE